MHTCMSSICTCMSNIHACHNGLQPTTSYNLFSQEIHFFFKDHDNYSAKPGLRTVPAISIAHKCVGVGVCPAILVGGWGVCSLPA